MSHILCIVYSYSCFATSSLILVLFCIYINSFRNKIIFLFTVPVILNMECSKFCIKIFLYFHINCMSVNNHQRMGQIILIIVTPKIFSDLLQRCQNWWVPWERYPYCVSNMAVRTICLHSRGVFFTAPESY